MTEETDVKELGSETQPVNETVGGVNNEPSAPADFVIPDEYKEAGPFPRRYDRLKPGEYSRL